MSKIVVLGAGVCGLAAGLLLGRDGHEVTVLERDPEPPPDTADDAWDGWARDGVSQFRLAHYLTPRGRIVLEEALPNVLAGLEAAGGAAFNPLPTWSSTPWAGARTEVGDPRPVGRDPLAEHMVAEHPPGRHLSRGGSGAPRSRRRYRRPER